MEATHLRISESVTTVARHFAEYINRVAFRGERFVLMRGNKPVAELSPVPVGMRVRDLPALLASLPRLSEEDATAFEADLAVSRAELVEAEVVDRWES